MILDWTQEALTGKYIVTGDPSDYNHELEQLDSTGVDGFVAGRHARPPPSADYLARKLTRAQVAQIEASARRTARPTTISAG